MPQLQVLQKQADPTAELLQTAGKNIVDNIQQQQAMKMYALELKQKMKQTDSEMEKAKLQSLLNFMDTTMKAKDQGMDPTMMLTLLKNQAGGESQLMHTMGQTGEGIQKYLEGLKEAPGTGQAELNRANAGNLRALSGMYQQVGNMMGGQAPGLQGAAQGAGAPMSSADVAPNNNSRLQAMGGQTQAPDQGGSPGGGLMLQDIKAGPISIGNPAYERAVATQKGLGEQDVTMSGTRDLYNQYMDKFNQVVSKLGTGNDPTKAAWVGGAAKMAAEHPWTGMADPDMQTLVQMKGNAKNPGPMSVRITSIMNAGRGNLPEVGGVSNIIPDPDLPSSTNQALDNAVRKILKSPAPQNQTQNAALRANVKDIETNVRDKGIQFTKQMTAKGVPPDQINRVLQQVYKEQGYLQ